MKIQESKNPKIYALIINQKVVNVFLWDGESDWNTEGEIVELPTKEYLNPETGETKTKALAGIGWDYIEGEFIDNRPVEDEFGNIVEPREPKGKE